MANLVRDGESRAQADVFIDAATPLWLTHSSHRGQAWTHTCTHTPGKHINSVKTLKTSPVQWTGLQSHCFFFTFLFDFGEEKENWSGRWEILHNTIYITRYSFEGSRQDKAMWEQQRWPTRSLLAAGGCFPHFRLEKESQRTSKSKHRDVRRRVFKA